MINKDRIQLRDCIAHIRQFVAEAEPNSAFMSQLAQYDLELLQKNEWLEILKLLSKPLFVQALWNRSALNLGLMQICRELSNHSHVSNDRASYQREKCN
jgi:hypothetical protein